MDDRLGTECVSHLTGVAAAAVAFNLRLLAAEMMEDRREGSYASMAG